MIRVRPYTRVSSIRKILQSQIIEARDQNKVFVEVADARRLSPADAEEKYGLDRGKANAYIEFDVHPDELGYQVNRRIQIEEHFLVGDVSLIERETEAFFNF